MLTTDEGQYPFKRRGDMRDQVLADMRWGLVQRGVTAADAAIATAPHSEYYIRADALDSVLMLDQARGEWLLAQLDPATAGTGALDRLWGKVYDFPRLPASGGSGDASAPCPALTHFVGSTTIGDPTAYTCTDGTYTYQVLYDVTSPSDASPATVSLISIDTGYGTNIQPPTQLTWLNAPDFVTQPATVTVAFSGGNPIESDRDYANRFLRRLRHKPAAGNNAQVRAWGEDASTNAIEACMVYACARYAGTTIVAPLQKRGNVLGPLARIPSVGTLATVGAYLTPPGSPVMPTPPAVWVVAAVPISTDMVIDLSMPVGSPAGYVDYQPFPGEVGGVAPSIVAITDQQHWQLNSPQGLPAGVTAPSMMVWNDAISAFEVLVVTSVTLNSGTVYDVVLAEAPQKTLAVGDFISPAVSQPTVIATAIQEYFDGLGPGELVGPSDLRLHRAARFPKPREEYPQRAGSGILSEIGDALGGTLADSNLSSVTVTLPPVPADPMTGPSLVVAGRMSITSF
jgi:baseplate J-like protein